MEGDCRGVIRNLLLPMGCWLKVKTRDFVLLFVTQQ